MFETFRTIHDPPEAEKPNFNVLDEMRDAQRMPQQQRETPLDSTVRAIIEMDGNRNGEYRVRHHLLEAYRSGGNDPQRCWTALQNFVADVNRTLGTRGNLSIVDLVRQNSPLANTIAVAEGVRNPAQEADLAVIGMNIRYQQQNGNLQTLGSIGILLNPRPR